MRLADKFTIWYIAITAMVLAISSFIVFQSIMDEIDDEARIKLNAWMKIAVSQLKDGVPLEELSLNDNIKIRELDYQDPLVAYYERDSSGVFPPRTRGVDRQLTIGQSFKINGKHYYILTSDFIAEEDDIRDGIDNSLIPILVVLLLFFSFVSFFVSRRLLISFYRALQAMKNFSLKKETPILLPVSNTKEFRELNRFLEDMTQKAVEDYRTLKEFSENASHEIQTPLAVIRGKLQLLMETGITKDQAAHIHSIENAVQKLSSLNQSLLLIAKLDNKEYEAREKIDFSAVISNSLFSFEELIEMKSIALEKEVQQDVFLSIHPYLADILVNNLLGNAIRHNVPDGRIRLLLSPKKLLIENTGAAPNVPTRQLFRRFVKGNQSGDSTGLGLAIVKQICDGHGYTITYQFTEGLHRIEILF